MWTSAPQSAAACCICATEISLSFQLNLSQLCSDLFLRLPSLSSGSGDPWSPWWQCWKDPAFCHLALAERRRQLAREHHRCFAISFQISCLFPLWSLMICEDYKPSTQQQWWAFKAWAAAKYSSSTAKYHSFQLLGFQLPKAMVCICQCHLVSLNSSPSPFGSITVNNKWSVGGCGPTNHSS